MAIQAAKDAGVEHYWIACSCMEDPNTEVSDKAVILPKLKCELITS